jgi:hypothetical protein
VVELVEIKLVMVAAMVAQVDTPMLVRMQEAVAQVDTQAMAAMGGVIISVLALQAWSLLRQLLVVVAVEGALVAESGEHLKLEGAVSVF